MSDPEDRRGREDARTAADGAGEVDLIKIRRSSGRHEWVTRRELELLNESRRYGQAVARLQRQRDLAMGAAAFVLVLTLGSQLILQRVREAGSLPLAGPSSDAAARRGGDPLQAPQPPPASAPEELVEAWAEARARRDFDAYLSFYSDRFLLPEGMSRGSWEALRRTRLMTVRVGSVTIHELETTAPDSDTRIARFVEHYRTPYSNDRVEKTLELILESGRWRILRERTLPAQATASPEGGDASRS